MSQQLPALLMLLMLISCSDNKYILSTKKAKDFNQKTVLIDSVEIPLPEHALYQYFTFSVSEIEGNTFFIGYNPARVGFDIFNLDRQIYVSSINLSKHPLFNNIDRKDQDKSKSIADVILVNFDSIFINLSNKQLLLIDSTFNVKLNIDLATTRRSSKRDMRGIPVSYSHSFKMTYIKAWSELIIGLVFNDREFNVKTPCFAFLNLKDTSLRSLPLYQSDFFYDEKGNMGMLGQINVSEHQKENLLTYNFAYESNIYQYNYETQNVTTYGGKSSLSENLVIPLVPADIKQETEWRIHMIENPQFFPVLYDKYRRMYYRFHLKEINYENGKYFNSVLDKDLILTVFNEDFELIRELQLPAKYYASYSWFVTPKGLYLSPTHKKNENVNSSTLKFNILNINL